MDIPNAFINEWNVLQTQSDAYEKHSLYIKLLGIAITACATLIQANLLLILLLATLWLQDAIWKTFQARISERLLKVEAALRDNNETLNNVSPCQLNSEWLAQRSGFSGLIKEYLCQAARPTVAFPYILLIGVAPFI
ncbi:hypothetical protein [Neptunomonas sp.]|uniref:hypothetical protein n=1 Tax=Neptunomonas sp. TaxID=1971898 RepID=UPI0025E34B8E|nr:hypothetical protein [Neptunomonas sp.]